MLLSGKNLFKVSCLSGTSVSPSLWVLCNIAPHHAKDTLSLYGLGLGINSMEAREQKHQKIKKYAENTTFQNKWPMIFRHEFLQEIFLRERGFDDITYTKKQNKYIPDILEDSCSTCRLKMHQDVCHLCAQVVIWCIFIYITPYSCRLDFICNLTHPRNLSDALVHKLGSVGLYGTVDCFICSASRS